MADRQERGRMYLTYHVVFLDLIVHLGRIT